MANAIYHAPAQCPVCGHSTTVTRVRCSHCGTELTGEFAPCRFCKLEEKHLRFIETFLRCRGSIKEVERALGGQLSHRQKYVGRGSRRSGPGPAPEERAQREKAEKAEVLSRLASGELDVEAAIQALNQLKGGA